METVTIVKPEKRQEMTLLPSISYEVPDTVWVLDAETKQMLDLKEIKLDQATKVIIVPKVRGG